ncbi:MAG: thioredoxin family protein [Bacteroidales bacterium]|jgi:thiol-disulfide isomerase/thioredoxin|nr:thioredoxin family protein [Bacteroidales bacterium]
MRKLKFNLLMPLLLFYALNLHAQCESHIKFDSLVNDKILIDTLSWDCFENAGFSEWFTANYDAYPVDSESLVDFQNNDTTIKMLIYLATWCPDTRRELPRMKKILDKLNVNWDINLIGLNRKKQLSDGESPENGITHVPSFVIFQNNMEIGRIVERPEQSLEKDLKKILNAK